MKRGDSYESLKAELSARLLAILEREVRRLREAEARVAADAAGFEDPERHRRQPR